MGSLSLEDALQLVVLYAEAEDDKFDKAAVRWLGRLLLERPMTLAVVAHSVELVSQLRGPGAGWSAGALETLARPSSPASWRCDITARRSRATTQSATARHVSRRDRCAKCAHPSHLFQVRFVANDRGIAVHPHPDRRDGLPFGVGECAAESMYPSFERTSPAGFMSSKSSACSLLATS